MFRVFWPDARQAFYRPALIFYKYLLTFKQVHGG